MDYVLDDHYVIAQNPLIKHPTITGFLSAGLFDSAHRQSDSQLSYYRPLLSASFALDYKLWGANPFAHRCVNLLFHIGNSLLVLWLINVLFVNFRMASIGAIFFSMLPIQEWSVRYIVGRGDLLSTTLSLLAILGVIHYLRSNKGLHLWAALISFIGALLSKESSLLTVGLIALSAFYLTKNIARTLKVSAVFLIVAIGYYLFRLQFLPIQQAPALGFSSIVEGLTIAFEYQLRFLMPWAVQAAMKFGSVVAVGLSALFAIIVLRSIDRQKERQHLVIFALVWLIVSGIGFVVVAPIIGRLGPILSEHFLYLNAVGFVALLALVIESNTNIWLKRLGFLGFVLYFLVIGFSNRPFWVSEEVLLRHVQMMENRKYTVAYEQLLMRYDEDFLKINDLIDRAPTGSTKSIWFQRLGQLYRKYNHYPQAKVALATAVDYNPHNIEALNALAVCHLETNQITQGIKLLNGSLLIDPVQSDAYRLLGVLYYRAGQLSLASKNLEMAWLYNPDDRETALHLMMTYYFLNNQIAYLEMIDQLSLKFSLEPVLKFAASEFFSHGYFKETIQILTQSDPQILKDSQMNALLANARSRISSLPK